MYAPKFGKILIVKLGDLGDAVVLSAAVDAASKLLPGCRIDLLLGTAGEAVFRYNSRVCKVWAFNRQLIEGRYAFSPQSLYEWSKLIWMLRRERYGAVILAHHLTTALGTLKLASVALGAGSPIRVGLQNGRGTFLTNVLPDEGFGAMCEGLYWVRLIGLLARREATGTLSFETDAATKARARRLIGHPGEGPVISLHHGLGGWIPSRAWTAEGFARTADLLHERLNARIMLIGGPEERRAAEEVAALAHAPVFVLAGKTDSPTLAALLELCDLHIGPDAGPTHVAMAVGTPVVSLWGPTNESAWGPCPEIGTSPAITVRAPNRPCPWVYVGHRMGEITRPSDLGNIAPESVVYAAETLLRETNPKERQRDDHT